MIFTYKVPSRYGQAILLGIALIVGIIQRINMSVCIVAMTSDKFVTKYGYPIYNWTEAQKSQVLSSLFVGYIGLQVFVGNLLEKKGTKVILAVALSVTSVSTVITPFAAEYGYMVVVALRVLEGLAQSALVPGINVHISKWIPPTERVAVLSLCLSGTAFAPLIGFPLCGYLAASSGGWPSVFYVTGGFGFVWVIIWLWISANSPSEHKSISKAERAYIETGLQQDMVTATPKRKTPWKAIFTSVPVYAMLIVSVCESWGFWTLLAEIPNYLNAVLDLDMKDNGLLSSLPYLSAYITSILYSGIATYVRNHFRISKTLHRNIWNSIALWGGSAALFIFTLMNRPSTSTAVLFLVLTVSLLTAKYNGYVTNPIDLSPNYCGTVAAIANTAGALGPICGPLCVGWLVDDPTSQEQWNLVFRVCSVIMVSGNLIYITFSSSEIQPWNNNELSVKFNKQSGNVEMINTITKL